MGILSQPHLLCQVLPLISHITDVIIINKTKQIKTKLVLAQLWHDGRMQDCRERILRGEKAPVIHVSGYILNEQLWYIPSDGNHRTLAAQEAGRRMITARVECMTECKPEKYTLASHVLWRLTDDKEWYEQIQTHIPEEIQEALIQTGVRRTK